MRKTQNKEQAQILLYADFCAPWYTGGSAEYVATFISFLKEYKIPFYLIIRKATGAFSNKENT